LKKDKLPACQYHHKKEHQICTRTTDCDVCNNISFCGKFFYSKDGALKAVNASQEVIKDLNAKKNGISFNFSL
jgi:hypothetical protein